MASPGRVVQETGSFSITAADEDAARVLGRMRGQAIPLLWAELGRLREEKRSDTGSAFLAAGVGLASVIALSKSRTRRTSGTRRKS